MNTNFHFTKTWKLSGLFVRPKSFIGKIDLEHWWRMFILIIFLNIKVSRVRQRREVNVADTCLFVVKILSVGWRISSTYELWINTNIWVKTIRSVCENNVVSWKNRSWKLMKNIYLSLFFKCKSLALEIVRVGEFNLLNRTHVR